MELIKQFLLDNVAINNEQVEEILDYAFAPDHPPYYEPYDSYETYDDLLALAQNWVICPNEKVSEWMIHFYSECFDICYEKAKCLLIDSFQNDKGLFADDATRFLYRREVHHKIQDGEFSFISQPCDCEECLVYS